MPNRYDQDRRTQLITPTEAAALVPAVRPWATGVAPATVRNWCRFGVRGVTLRHERIDGRIFTSEAWLDEFLQAITPEARRASHADQA